MVIYAVEFSSCTTLKLWLFGNFVYMGPWLCV